MADRLTPPASDPALDPAAVDVAGAHRRVGAAHRTDTERVPLSRARGRVLAESVTFAAAVPSSGPLSQASITLPAGHRLASTDLGALAAAGHATLPCARRPTVALFTSGDALRPPGQSLAAGERHDACGPLLLALLQEAGLDPVAWPILAGAPERAAPALADAAQAFDLVIACSDADATGAPWLCALIDGAAVAAFGLRAPRSVLMVLPNDREAIASTWAATGAALIDAMQGARADDGDTDIDVRDAAALLADGARLYDVREPAEHALGRAEGATPLPLSQLEADATLGTTPGDGFPRADGVVLLICAKGQRSRRAAALLRERGVADVRSLRGGLEAWRAAGLPVAAPPRPAATAASDADAPALPRLDADALERYDRHLRFASVGVEGQQRLLASRVVIVGAGGLGSPAAFYLAAAGVGQIALVDDDRVERSNLQRQILHVDAAVGTSKVASARERLLALNPRIAIDAIDARVAPDNVESLLRGADVVIDGSDNFATRYLVDAACLRLGLPLVYGAVERFTGQVSVFDAGRQRGRAPCYRCLFPEPPGADAAPNCAEAGVLGVLPGLVGMLQATEALKLVLGIGEPLVGRLLTIDALTMRFRELALDVDADCPGCGAGARFDGYAAIETACASR